MSRPLLLGVGVKDLLQLYLRNPLNLCTGLPFCWTFKSTRWGWIQDMNKVSCKVTPHAGKSGGGIMKEKEFLRASQDLCRGWMRMWHGGSSTAQGKSPFPNTEIWGCFGCPSADVAKERRKLSPCCSHLCRDRQTYDNKFTANLAFSNHIMMFHPGFCAPNVCFFRKIKPKELKGEPEDN